MKQDTVLIVVATYNGEKFLREQLDSLLSQSYENIAVEICDDGSSDETLAIAEEYCEKDKRCLLYTSPSPRDPKTSRMPSSA